MERLFEEEIKKIEDIFLDIKYEGTSFDGVMNIHDLGHELVGLEYSLRSIFKKLKVEYLKEISNGSELKEAFDELNITDIEILTEGFVDNCFLKRIKFKDFFDGIEERPELMKFITVILSRGIAVYGAIAVAQIAADSNVLRDAFRRHSLPQEVVMSIQESSITAPEKAVALKMMQTKRFRDEMAKTIYPLKSNEDYMELKSLDFPDIDDNSIKIDSANKESFLISLDVDLEEDESSVNLDKVIGRISSIHLDATKNQIGFKVMNEGSEIDCSLIETLDIQDYKEYLDEWVEVYGLITYSHDKTEHIEIHSVSKINSPEESGQLSMKDDLNKSE